MGNTVEGGNFQHLANFEAQLKICRLKAYTKNSKILLGVATPFGMVFATANRTFFKPEVFEIPILRLIFDDLMFLHI